MPLEFIPNQPYIFASPIGSQPCLNNDNRQYRQLVQNGDKICAQWKMLPCTEDLICNGNIDEFGSDLAGAWTAGANWSSTGSDNLSYSGIGSTSNSSQTVTTVSGKTYRLKFILSNNGIYFEELIASFGLVNSSSITDEGFYTLYFTATSNSTLLKFTYNGSALIPSDFLIDNIELVELDCWTDDLYIGTPSWSYTYDGANGKFCSADVNGGDLINSNAYITDGNYHRVQLNITDCNAGGLQVYLGSVLIGTTSGNGLFTFYGTPTSGNDLTLVKTGLFDGCVSQVEVDDYGDVTADYEVFLSGTATSDSFIPDVFEDRLVFCKTTGEFTSMTFEWECGAYRLNISSACDAETYTSVNELSYDTVGWDCTKVVEAWNDGTAFGFYFGSIAAPDFTLYQRLRVLQFNPKYPNASEEYLFSNGSKTRSYAQAGKARICHFDYVDEYAHDVIRIQLLSSKLFIDSYAFYFPTADYEPEWGENGRYNLAQSKVDLEHEQTLFSTACGVTGNAICPPQQVQVPQNYNGLQLKLAFDNAYYGIDLTNFMFEIFYFNDSGYTGGVGMTGPYDLTILAGRNSFKNDVISFIDSVLIATTSGTVSLTGTNLNINLSSTGTWTYPQQTMIFSLTDNVNTYRFPVPVIFTI